jgi:3'-phosphoadenosine 5'-phosphosulfate sulfotransferase (PAPS reductase)/FAD synthetase
MEMGAALAISISGGKDSDAMLRHLVALHHTQGWKGKLFAITADLGRIEWPGTLEHMKTICNQLNVELIVVRRQKGGMIDRWEERRQTLMKQQDVEAIAPEVFVRYWNSEGRG